MDVVSIAVIKNSPPTEHVRPEVVQPPKSMPQTLKLNGPAPQFHKEINPLSGQTGEYCYLWDLFGSTSRHKPLPP